jgi:dUTP pyrophosphatase
VERAVFRPVDELPDTVRGAGGHGSTGGHGSIGGHGSTGGHSSTGAPPAVPAQQDRAQKGDLDVLP